MPHQHYTGKLPSTFLLFFFVSFAAVGAVLFTPAMPQMTQYFHLQSGEIELIVTFYLIGYAIGQLFYGPIANHLGRRRTLILGIGIGAIGGVLCALATFMEAYYFLLVARFIMGFGATAGVMVSFAMIADVYLQHEAAGKIGSFVIAFAVAPPLAVSIGGFLTQHYGWESTFLFTALYGIILFFAIFLLPETHGIHKEPPWNPKHLLSSYFRSLKNPKLLTCGALMGCGTSMFYTFSSRSPYQGIEIIGLSPQEFGLLNLITLVGMFVGGPLSSKLLKRFQPLQIIFIGSTFVILNILVMIGCFLAGWINPWTLFLPMAAIYCGLSISYPQSSSIALAQTENKGHASSVISFLNLGTAAVSVIVSGMISPDSSLALPLLFLTLSGLIFLLWSFLSQLIAREAYQK